MMRPTWLDYIIQKELDRIKFKEESVSLAQAIATNMDFLDAITVGMTEAKKIPPQNIGPSPAQVIREKIMLLLESYDPPSAYHAKFTG